MVIFDQLRISDDGKKMYINAHVNKASYFENISIDSVIIMTADQALETSIEPSTENAIYTASYEGEIKEINLVLTSSDFMPLRPKAVKFVTKDMSDTLFFVYIKCKGTPDICTPCTLDEEYTLGVVFDENLLYQRVMDYTKELTDNCCVHTGFIDFILLWNAFKAAIETEHYVAAIKFYNMLFGNSEVTGSTKYIGGCGCHG